MRHELRTKRWFNNLLEVNNFYQCNKRDDHILLSFYLNFIIQNLQINHQHLGILNFLFIFYYTRMENVNFYSHHMKLTEMHTN